MTDLRPWTETVAVMTGTQISGFISVHFIRLLITVGELNRTEQRRLALARSAYSLRHAEYVC